MLDLMARTALSEQEQYQQLVECLRDIRYADPPMIRVDPYRGIEAASPDDPVVRRILEGDEEVIFCFGPDGIYLSCQSSDIIRQDESILLTGPGVVFKLNEEDHYEPFSDREVLDVIGHYADALWKMKIGICCIPVLRLTCDDQPNGR